MTLSLVRGLDILQLLADRGEARLSEIVEIVEGSRATLFRLLIALESRDFVVHDRVNHVYRLGPSIPALAGRADSSSLIERAAPVMEALRATTGETINLAVLRRGRMFWAATVEGDSAIRFTTVVGDEVEAHCTAAGKAILAAMPRERWDGLLGPEPFAARTEKTITSKDRLFEELKATKKRGFSVDDGENEVGGACVAAAVLDSNGEPVGAISVTGIAQRLPARQRPALGRIVREAADKLSAEFQRPSETLAAAL